MLNRFIIVYLFPVFVFGQTKNERDTAGIKQKILLELNSKYYYGKYKNGLFFKVKGQEGEYQNQGMYHSSYYHLNKDSSFVYYSVFEGGYNMTFGNWTGFQNKITLTWDSLKTFSAVKDTGIYKKYYRYSRPNPFKISNKKFTINDSCLIPVK